MMKLEGQIPSHEDAARRRQQRVRKRTGRYLRGAIDLRNSVHFTWEDYDFAHRRRGEIRYLLDANVVRFFLNPFIEFRKVAPFDRSDRDTLQAVAAVTAEFIFSRALCGQWGAAPMISRWHAREIDGYARELSEHMRRMVKAGREEGDDGVVDAQIAELIADAKSLANRRDVIDNISGPLRGLGDRMASKAFEARQFARMMRDNLLNPLHMDRHANDAVMADPPPEETRSLIDRIGYHKHMFGADDAGNVHKLESDARTLIEVVRLNAAAAIGARHPVRYVLVTADQSLFNAAIDWLASDAAGPIDFFPVRRISQYIPILNTADMPNNVAENELFDDVRDSLDAFLSVASLPGRRYPRPLPAWSHTGRASADNPFREQLSEFAGRMEQQATSDPHYLATLDQVTKLWSKLSRESVFLNASLLGRRINAFISLADFLQEAEDIRRAVLHVMEETAGELERAHIKLTVQHHFGAVVRQLRSEKSAGSLRRGMVVLATRFEEFVDGRPLFSFLNEMVTEPDRLPLGRLLHRLSGSSTHRALFFSGCVAFWASQWNSARFLLDRALETCPAEDEGRPASRDRTDLEYFTAVVRRFAAMDANISPARRITALAETLKTLDEQLSRAIEHDDPFGCCRLNLEMGLVKISVAYAHHVAGEPIDRPSAHQLAEQALEHFGRAIHRLQNVLREQRTDTGVQLKMELLMGMTGCVIYKVFFEEKAAIETLSEWRSLAGHIREIARETGPSLPQLYSLAPDLLEVVFERNPSRKIERRTEIVQRMQSFGQAAADRTRFDLEILPVLAKRLKAAATH